VTLRSYDQNTGTLNKISSPGWHLIELPVGFCVFDVLLVQVGTATKIYGVQITISKNPFVAHDTHETCKKGSEKRITTLMTALQTSFKTKEIVYVMFAPKAAEGSFAAPGHKAAYYFAPAEKIGSEFVAKNAKKRKSENLKCCNCSTGTCVTKSCSCHGAGKLCTNCTSSNCKNKDSAKKGKK
jgi:hypothetical protein